MSPSLTSCVDRFVERPDGSRIRFSDRAPKHASRGDVGLILSNSLATDAGLWSTVVPLLPTSLRIVTYDTRGHGGSTAAGDDTRIETLASDLLAVLDAAGLNTALVVGISLGGMTALQLGLQAPDRLAGIMPCHCRSGFDSAARALWQPRIDLARTEGTAALAQATLERWFTERARAQDPDSMRRVLRMIESTSAHGYVACVQAIMNYDLTDSLPRIATPALLVAGAQDASASAETMLAMARAMPRARLETLDPCGHLSAIERPIDLARLITGFARECLPRAFDPTPCAS